MNTLVHYRPSALQIPSETRSTETRDHRCFEILCCLHTANLAPNPLFVQLVIKTLVRQMTSFMLPFFSRRKKLSIFRLCDLRSYSFLGTLIQSWRLREASVMQYRLFFTLRGDERIRVNHMSMYLADQLVLPVMEAFDEGWPGGPRIVVEKEPLRPTCPLPTVLSGKIVNWDDQWNCPKRKQTHLQHTRIG